MLNIVPTTAGASRQTKGEMLRRYFKGAYVCQCISMCECYGCHMVEAAVSDIQLDIYAVWLYCICGLMLIIENY